MWKQDYESDVINTQFGETKENFYFVFEVSLFVCLFVYGVTAPSGAGPPHSQDF
jgi:hypothetical protein